MKRGMPDQWSRDLWGLFHELIEGASVVMTTPTVTYILDLGQVWSANL